MWWWRRSREKTVTVAVWQRRREDRRTTEVEVGEKRQLNGVVEMEEKNKTVVAVCTFFLESVNTGYAVLLNFFSHMINCSIINN